MENKNIDLLKQKMDFLDIKVIFEKTRKRLNFNTIENENEVIISLKGIFWKKNDWRNYKILYVEKIFDKKNKEITQIKKELIYEIMDKGIKIFL